MSKFHGRDDATALVGMAELVVGAQVLRDGEWWLLVETGADRAWCPSCAVRAIGHGRARTVVQDLPIAGVPTVSVFARRRWRCAEALCEVNTWSEDVDAIARRASLTVRARVRLGDMVNIDGFLDRCCSRRVRGRLAYRQRCGRRAHRPSDRRPATSRRGARDPCR